MSQETPTRRTPAASREPTLRAFQLFFALHCAGLLALKVAPEGEHGLRSILHLLAVGAPAPAGIEGSTVGGWQLFTHGFLHLHPLEFAVSVTFLLALGGEVERALGSVRFAGLYLGSQALVAVAHTGLARVADGGMPPVLGSLGGASALLAVYVLIDPRRRTFGIIPSPGFFVLAASVLFAVTAYLENEPRRHTEELLRLPLTASFGPEAWLDRQWEIGTRAQAALPHLFGILGGAGLLAADRSATRVLNLVRVKRDIRVLEEELSARARVEELLEKISRDGLESLSRRERNFLRYASRRFYPPGHKTVM